MRRRRSLKAYLASSARRGGVVEVEAFCSTEFEMSELAHRLVASGDERAILFRENATGYPVVMNLYASRTRLLELMQAQSYEELQERIVRIFSLLTSPPTSLKAKWHSLQFVRSLLRVLPRPLRGSAPVQECIEREPDLNTLPILKTWPHDAERFLTLPMVITQSLRTGMRNVGMYRMQVLDKQTTAMHWHIHKTGAKHYAEYAERGERMPVAVALGGDPLLAYCATAPLPEGVDEFLFAGFLRKHPVHMVKGITVPLDVPAEADFILEGYIDPKEEKVLEGAFGDHTGFYSLPDFYPRFHITCITHRRDAVYPATVVGVPPMEDAIIAEVTERIFEPIFRQTFLPELRRFHFPTAGVAHNLLFLHAHAPYPAEREKLAHTVWSAGQMMFTKYIVWLPESVRSYDDVLRLLACVTAKDFFFSEGVTDVLEHATSGGKGSKLLIDCMQHSVSADTLVWKYGAEALKGAAELWLGDQLILRVVVGEKDITAAEAETYLQAYTMLDTVPVPRFWLFLDAGTPYTNPYQLLWLTLANTDPLRDIWLFDGDTETVAMIDARAKFATNSSMRWPNVVVSDDATIALVDRKWDEYGLGIERIPSPSLSLRSMLFNEDSAEVY